MSELLKLINVSYEIKGFHIFKPIRASVQQGDVIGVIGKNGSGKSTLLQLINNELEPTGGRIEWLQQLKIERLEQETKSYVRKYKEPLEQILLDKWNVPSQDYQNLSGGEKLKARLAATISTKAELLLLDEPTNHLDEQSIELLIQEIKQYKGTFIVVSHDRYFLDTIATKIWSIENKELIERSGNYSSYMLFRKHNRLTQQRAYEKQQKKIKRVEAQMNELSSWSNKAHAQSTKQEGTKEFYRKKAKRMDAQVKSKQKRLEKELEKAEVNPVEPEYEVEFSMKGNNKVGKRLLEVKDLTKAFNGRIIFENIHFTIQHGEKVAFIGPNGSGKTTLLKIILGKVKAAGEVWVSPSANIGYLTQEVFDLPLDQTPEKLFFRETYEARGKVQNLMRHLGFIASQWTEPIKYMSMGERVKCKLMMYILEEKDALILDEPTNHLDLPSREQLENTLAQYNGTLIVVSHDRYFLDKVTNSTFYFENKNVKKQWIERGDKRDYQEELRLKLEAERQEVLGKLSFMTPSDEEYGVLDQKFNELTKQINSIS